VNVPDSPTHAPLGLTVDPGPTRRRVLAGAGLVVAGGVVTAACGSSSDPSAAPEPSSPDSGNASPDGGTGGSGTEASIDTADVPEGGGLILDETRVVVTQPLPGEFRAFSAVCTHMGCTVASVADGQITCPCHGSTFSIADGSVTGGPASAPLPEVPVNVSGSSLTLG
jgi:Rieske Fe-S protein